MNGMFLKSNDSKYEKPVIQNRHTSMSTSPATKIITPASIVKSSFRDRNKKFKFTSKLGSKGMKCFSINSSLSKNVNSKNENSRSRVSSTSFNLSSGHELDKVSSLLAKIKDISKVKDNLAVSNQQLKFKVAELQKEKYSLSQLNKKLSSELEKLRY